MATCTYSKSAETASGGGSSHSDSILVSVLNAYAIANIPPYSKINSVTISCEASNNASGLTNGFKADIQIGFRNSGGGFISTIYSQDETIDNSYDTYGNTATGSFYSETENAGCVNIAHANDLCFYISGTWSRVFYIRNIKVVWDFTPPVFDTTVNDLNYDNLFSFSEFAKSSSQYVEGTGTNGKVTIDNIGGIVTVSGNGDVYTAMRSPQYSIPVSQGQQYVFRYDVESAISLDYQRVQAFVFYINDAGNIITDPSTGFYFKHTYKGEHLYFTPPSGCTRVFFRFGVANGENTAKYSHIALYKVGLGDGIINRQYRKVFESGSPVGILYTPERPGYVFQGWYTGENGTGQHIRKIDTLSANTTVYSHWVKRGYYDVNYDNLFSFSDWAYSPSGRKEGLSDSAYIGTITTDIPNGTITVKGADPNGSAFYTMYGSFSPYHHIPVVAGQQYAFRYTVSQTYNMQAFVFFCNDNQDFVTDPSTGLQFVFDTNGNDLVFTPPSGCTNVCFRLGVGGINTAVYSNIGLYKTSVEQGVTNRQIRKNISIGSTVGTLHTPSKEGYAFKGWYTGENGAGNKVNSSDIFTKGLTVYSAWNVNKIYVGTSRAKEIYVGTTPVKEIYVGTTKVYEQ